MDLARIELEFSSVQNCAVLIFEQDLENQMDIAEKRRLILVKDFLEA